MKKILTILVFTLLSSSFAEAVDPPALSARDTTNIIVAQDRQNQTLGEYGDGDQDDSPKVTLKDLNKAVTMKVVVSGNKSISTEDIKSVIKPYLKNEITAAERILIIEEIQRLYVNKGYPTPTVNVESAGFNMNVMVIEE